MTTHSRRLAACRIGGTAGCASEGGRLRHVPSNWHAIHVLIAFTHWPVPPPSIGRVYRISRSLSCCPSSAVWVLSDCAWVSGSYCFLFSEVPVPHTCLQQHHISLPGIAAKAVVGGIFEHWMVAITAGTFIYGNTTQQKTHV